MMTTNLLSLTSISQWGLFLGIVFVIYGWLEKKDKFILAGHFTFFAISLLAIWIVLTHQIEASISDSGVLTKAAKVLGFFKGYIWFSLLNVIGFLMKLFKLRFQKLVLAGLILYALMLFFMLYSVMQTPG